MPFARNLEGFPTEWTAVHIVTMSRRVAEVAIARARLDGIEVERVTDGHIEHVVLAEADVVCWRALPPTVIAEPVQVRSQRPKLSVVR